MTKDVYQKALKKLKSINKLTLSGPTTRIKSEIGLKDVYRTEYKDQIIFLGDVRMIVSGIIENYYSMNHTVEKTFLCIALIDENDKDLGLTSGQNYEIKNQLKKLITQ